jgi:hypothetical protein
MPLGGFAPCPLPLGGTALDGWSAEQHARLAADLKAAVSAAPFAVYSRILVGGLYVETYFSQYGNGVNAKPTLTTFGAGTYKLDWNSTYSDEYDNVYPVNIKHAKTTHVWDATTAAPAYLSVTLAAPNSVYVIAADKLNFAVDASFTLVVW